MKICPKCGGKTFNVTAHVTQEWIVDHNGNYISSINECIEVTHAPADDDIWECASCGYNAEGSKFNTT